MKIARRLRLTACCSEWVLFSRLIGTRGGIQRRRSRCGILPASLTKYEEKEYYGNVKIVPSSRSGIDRRVDAIGMRSWFRSTHQHFLSPSRHMQTLYSAIGPSRFEV